MASISGTCEIIEAKEEHYICASRSKYKLDMGEKDWKPVVLKLKCKDSLENDINKLFEAVSAKTSSKALGHSTEACSSPSTKNSLKKPMTVGVPHSPRFGSAESASLKQALRDLCISKASEMAAVKRLSKLPGSSGVSEAGRIKSLYNLVVDGNSCPSRDEGGNLCISTASKMTSIKRLSKLAGSSGVHDSNVDTSLAGRSLDDCKGTMVDTSLVPTGSRSSLSNRNPLSLQALNTKSLNQSSPSCSRPTKKSATGTASMQEDIISPLVPLQIPKIKASTVSFLQCAVEATQDSVQMIPMHSEIASSSMHGQMPLRKTSNKSVSTSQKFVVSSEQDGNETVLMQNEVVSASKRVAIQTLKAQQAPKEKHTPIQSQTGENAFEPRKRVPAPTKLANKASASKSARRGRLPTVTSSILINGSRVRKLARNTQRVARPAARSKNLVKKKRQDSASTSFSSNLGPRTNELMICQRCHHTSKDANKESNQDSLASHVSPSTEVHPVINDNSGTGKSDFNSKPVVVKVKKDSKSRHKGEFSQSSKSSLGDNSTSTNTSDESNVSGSSCGNRPHMSKDARWEAVRQVRMQHGFLGLSHFNLLKKLGCGDIGTVYLAELIGTNFLFAIKVMDNEFLERRKKMPRAQTEREILRMLDHPFLPTLYAQFISDDLSCLVMEYCPGGDLHVLRQKQHARSFPEPAARFYVAEVLLALEYLHMLGVIYRDLKPENILVREDGHIMLTDFDLSLRCTVNPTLLKSSSCNVDPLKMSGPCKESSCIGPFCIEPSCDVPCFSPRFLPAAARAAKTRKIKADFAARIRSLPQLVAEPTDARSNSFVGTHEYLAPEIIQGEGHGAAVDWWTFGIFLYELLYGRTPFKGSNNEETLVNVVIQSLKFPDSPIVSFQARDLIQGLLVKEPENRLGSEKGAAEIKQHPFFEGLNWALIRCVVPPEQPESHEHLEFEFF